MVMAEVILIAIVVVLVHVVAVMVLIVMVDLLVVLCVVDVLHTGVIDRVSTQLLLALTHWQ